MDPIDRDFLTIVALGGGGLAALAASFVVINLGLRLIPEGRAFLAAARAEGRLFANPRRDSPGRVKAVFALALAVAALAGLGVFLWMDAALEPVYWHAPRPVAARAGPA